MIVGLCVRMESAFIIARVEAKKKKEENYFVIVNVYDMKEMLNRCPAVADDGMNKQNIYICVRDDPYLSQIKKRRK